MGSSRRKGAGRVNNASRAGVGTRVKEVGSAKGKGEGGKETRFWVGCAGAKGEGTSGG